MDDELQALRQRRVEELQRQAGSASEGPVEVTEASFESFVKSHPVAMIDVWAEWCGPCRTMEPIVEELATEFRGKAAIGKLDADTNGDVVMKYGIRGIPSFLFFKDGQLVGRLVGARPKRDFREVLAQLAGVSVDADQAFQ